MGSSEFIAGGLAASLAGMAGPAGPIRAAHKNHLPLCGRAAATCCAANSRLSSRGP